MAVVRGGVAFSDDSTPGVAYALQAAFRRAHDFSWAQAGPSSTWAHLRPINPQRHDKAPSPKLSLTVARPCGCAGRKRTAPTSWRGCTPPCRSAWACCTPTSPFSTATPASPAYCAPPHPLPRTQLAAPPAGEAASAFMSTQLHRGFSLPWRQATHA